MIHEHIHDEPLEKSIIAQAGSRHHMRELQKLESMLYTEFDVNTWYKNTIQFIDKQFPEATAQTVTVKDLLKIDEFIKSQTLNITAVEQYLVRAFIVGKIIQERSGLPIIPKEIELKKLPDTISKAMKQYNLTEREAFSLQRSQSHAAQHMVSATNTTVNRVQSLVSDSILQHTSRKELAKKLFEEFTDDSQEINRNWNRVSISEISYAYNNGYLSTLKVNSWVVGISMPDRCEHCGALIDGKVYPFIDTTNEAMESSNLDPDSKEYQRRTWIASNCIWLGKDNYGRSGAKRKRTADGMIDRRTHELYFPALPMHPYCFKGNSLVTMADGSPKEIKNIAVGDRVITGRGKSNKVEAISVNSYSGKFNTITTENGESIESTCDHKILICREECFYWAEAQEIIPGDKIVKLKQKTGIDLDILKNQYEIEQKSVLQLSKHYGVSRTVISDRLRKIGCSLRNGSQANIIRFKDPIQRINATEKAHISVREKAAKGEWGLWAKGRLSWSHGLTKEQNGSLAKISESKLGEKNPMFGKFMEKSSNFKTGKKVYRRHFLRNREQRDCNRCGAVGENHIHHSDRNRDNNDLSNLEILCASCHSLEHQKDRKREKNEKGQFLPVVRV